MQSLAAALLPYLIIMSPQLTVHAAMPQMAEQEPLCACSSGFVTTL